DLGKTIYTDKPCLNGDEVKQIAPNGNPSAEYVARMRMKARAEEQRAIEAARAAKREAEVGKAAKCVKGAAAPGREPEPPIPSFDCSRRDATVVRTSFDRLQGLVRLRRVSRQVESGQETPRSDQSPGIPDQRVRILPRHALEGPEEGGLE